MSGEPEVVRSTFNGGIFQYIPFECTEWIPNLVLTGFVQPKVVIMLMITFTMLVGQVYYLATFTRSQRKTRMKPGVDVKVSGIVQQESQGSTEETNGSVTETIFDAVEMGELSLMCSKERRPEWDVAIVVPREKFPKRKATRAVHMYTGSNAVFNFLSAVGDTNSLISTQSTWRVKAKALSDKHIIERVQRGTKRRRRIAFITLMTVLLFCCFSAHFISLSLAIRSERRLMQTLDTVPAFVRYVTLKLVRFGNFSLDAVYNLFIAHIMSDATQTSTHSHLQRLVGHAEKLVAEMVACLITNCMDSSGHRRMLIDQTNSTSQLAQELLMKFLLVVHRIDKLYETAMILNSSFVYQVTRSWYMYQRELWAISSKATIPQHFPNGTSEIWTQYPWFNQTKTVLCNHLLEGQLRQFSDCNQVANFVLETIDYIQNVPFILPSKILENVSRFAFIPRALGVEEQFVQWLPVITDLHRQGAIFLLNKFLRPEITRFKWQMSTVASSIPTESITTKIVMVSRMFDIVMLNFITLCFVCGFTGMAISLITLIRQYRLTSSKTNSFVRAWDISLSASAIKWAPNQLQSCLCVAFGVLSALCLAMVLTSVGFVHISNLIDSEFCIYLFKGTAQVKADIILSERVKTFLSSIPVFKEMVKIPHLSLAIPYPILNTLDTEYHIGDLSLSRRLHVDKPLNFNALFRSKWFAKALQYLWNNDARRKLERLDLTRRIPKLSLLAAFEQTRKTMKLENSFDYLKVGNTTDYLNQPGPKYFQVLSDSLDEVGTINALHLSGVYKHISKLQMTYADNYNLVAKTLEIIETNKVIIEPLLALVANASQALDNLNKMDNHEILFLLNQLVSQIWTKMIPAVTEHAVPFLMNFLQDLIPFPGLRNIYHQTVSPVCPIPLSVSSAINSSRSFPRSALGPELDRLGSCIFLCLISSVIPVIIYAFST